MHIALVTPYCPTPSETGGRARIARLSSALAQQGQLHLFAAVTDEDLASELARGGGGLDPYARVVTYRTDVRPAAGSEPTRVRRFPLRLAVALAAAHDASPFDVVVVFHSYAGPGIARLRNATIVLDEPSVRSNVELRNLRTTGSQVVSRLLAIRRWRRFERTMWSKPDAITVARSVDASVVHAHRPDTGVVVPDGVDVERLPYRPPSRRQGNTVLFVGDMRAPANVLGATEMAQQVLPRLRVRVEDATLTLAGRFMPKEVQSLESDNVRVATSRTSTMALYRDHAVFAVPPIAGRDGTRQVKEPMSCGMPIVAPPSALREMPVEEGRDFVGARSTDELADRLAGVLMHRSELDSMALSARRIAERHDWELMGERFARIVMATVARKRP